MVQATTTGHVIVMGRKTLESIGKPPSRNHRLESRGVFHPGERRFAT